MFCSFGLFSHFFFTRSDLADTSINQRKLYRKCSAASFLIIGNNVDRERIYWGVEFEGFRWRDKKYKKKNRQQKTGC